MASDMDHGRVSPTTTTTTTSRIMAAIQLIPSHEVMDYSIKYNFQRLIHELDILNGRRARNMTLYSPR